MFDNILFIIGGLISNDEMETMTREIIYNFMEKGLLGKESLVTYRNLLTRSKRRAKKFAND